MNKSEKIIFSVKNYLIRFSSGNRFILIARRVGLVLLVREESRGMRLN